MDLLRGRGRPDPAAAKARTWARRGHTPVVTVSGGGSGRVSIAGLVCLRPGTRSRLLYRMRIHRGHKGERRSMSEAGYAGLIAAAHRQLHAPDLNPAEGVWANMKNGLGNLAASSGGQLAAVKNRLKRIQYRPPALTDSSLRPDSASNPNRRIARTLA